jgi:hypothetical protein
MSYRCKIGLKVVSSNLPGRTISMIADEHILALLQAYKFNVANVAHNSRSNRCVSILGLSGSFRPMNDYQGNAQRQTRNE